MTAFESSPGLQVALHGGVLRLTLDRPEVRNALDDSMIDALVAHLSAAHTDEDVRAVLLAGAGESFCGGADVVARNARDADAPRPRPGSVQRRLLDGAHRLVLLLTEVQVPVVCAVQGWAAGIGLHLAMAADLTVVADDARLWEPFAARGFTPDSGGTWLLPRLVGLTRAKEMLLLGRSITGQEAAGWGLVHRAVPAAEVAGVAEALAAELASGPTVALGLTKWLLHRGLGTDLDRHLPDEALALELSSRTADFREGMAAFVERRDPRFEGR